MCKCVPQSFFIRGACKSSLCKTISNHRFLLSMLRSVLRVRSWEAEMMPLLHRNYSLPPNFSLWSFSLSLHRARKKIDELVNKCEPCACVRACVPKRKNLRQEGRKGGERDTSGHHKEKKSFSHAALDTIPRTGSLLLLSSGVCRALAHSITSAYIDRHYCIQFGCSLLPRGSISAFTGILDYWMRSKMFQFAGKHKKLRLN